MIFLVAVGYILGILMRYLFFVVPFEYGKYKLNKAWPEQRNRIVTNLQRIYPDEKSQTEYAVGVFTIG